MVDTQDLKSCDHNGCAGSSPAPGTSLKQINPVIQAITGFFFLMSNRIVTLFTDFSPYPLLYGLIFVYYFDCLFQ
jgi:hypothetical protein